MHRDDFDKLLELLGNNSKYRITTVYDLYVLCIQYRFCLRDENVPSFIDIGVWDYATEYTPEKDKRLQEICVELMDELSKMISKNKFPYWKYQALFFKPGCGQIISEQCLHSDNQSVEQATIESRKIESVFSKYIQKAIDEKILLPTDAGDKAKSYAYSLDNLLIPGRQMLFPKGMIHPTIRLPYENLTVECPNDSKAFLDTCYSD